MYSIKFDESIIKSEMYVHVDELLTHEQVVIERRDALSNYINSLSPDIIISSIIVCHESNVIIDGHHRFSALQSLGFKKIPVTYIDYSSNSIITTETNSLNKSDIILRAKNRNLYVPKSTKHLIQDSSSHKWYPIILLSTLFYL